MPRFVTADASSPHWRSPLAGAVLPAGVSDISREAGGGVAALGPPAGVAGLELAGPLAGHALRRLTDADLGELPALAPLAGVRALVERTAHDTFRVWFPQEYADHVAEAVVDAWEGLA